MFLLNGQPLPIDTPFKDADGNSYPANWLRLTSLEEKQAIGITEIIVDNSSAAEEQAAPQLTLPEGE